MTTWREFEKNVLMFALIGFLFFSILLIILYVVPFSKENQSSGYFSYFSEFKEETSKVEVTINGMKKEIALSQPVKLPLDKKSASFINQESGCNCSGEIKKIDNSWVARCCDEYPDCYLKIEITTGKVECKIMTKK